MNYIDVNSHNLCIVNFHDIFLSAEVDIINDLNTFDLIDDFKFQRQDAKKIIYHHIIHQLCETIVHHMTFNKIIVCCHLNDLKDCNLVSLSSKFRHDSFLGNTIKKIKNILPIRIVMIDTPFKELIEIINNQGGERIELLSALQLCKNNVTSFEKVKSFAKKYELDFLSKEFFNRVKTKNLMFS